MKVIALDTCDACELSDVQMGKNMTMKIFFLVTQRNGLNSIVSDDIEDRRALTLTTMETLETTMETLETTMLTMLKILTILTMWTMLTMTMKTLETGGSPKCGGC